MLDVRLGGETDLAALKAKARWLSAFASNVTSQCGEDGILAKCLDLLPQRDGWCVEFGAHDGKEWSNTYSLVEDRGYRAVLIEPDLQSFQKLQAVFAHHDRVTSICAFVGFDENDGLDALLAPLPIPNDFDLCIIDVDGNDYHIWDAIRRYRPKIVAIEYNFTITNCVRFVQEKSPSVNQGSSASAIVGLAKTKGYELVSAPGSNLIFVAAEYFDRFGIPDNSLELIRDDSECPQVFVAYDGTLKLAENGRLGSVSLRWHDGLSVREASIQPLPRFLRTLQINYPRWKFWALRLRHPSTISPGAAGRAVRNFGSFLARRIGSSNVFR